MYNVICIQKYIIQGQMDDCTNTKHESRAIKHQFTWFVGKKSQKHIGTCTQQYEK